MQTIKGNKPIVIEHCPLFAGISSKERRHILSTAPIRQFLKGQIIHRQGEPVEELALLTSGCAKLVQFSSNGAEVIFRLCGPGELVGLEEVLTKYPNRTTVHALQSCEAVIWPITTFDFLCQRFSRLGLNAVTILGAQLKEMEERFTEISTKQVPARLSRELARLTDQIGYQENGMLVIHISREELGQLTGISLYTVSRVLSEWQRRGILRTRTREICIQNWEALECLYSPPLG